MEWENLSRIKMIMLYRKNKNGQLIWDANIFTFIQCFTWHQQQKQLISLPVPLDRDLGRKSQKYWKKRAWCSITGQKSLALESEHLAFHSPESTLGLVKDTYLSPEKSVMCAGREKFSSFGTYTILSQNWAKKDPSFPSLWFEASDLHLGSALAGSWGRTFVDTMCLASISMWVKHRNAGRNCLPNSQEYRSHRSRQYTHDTNLSLHAGCHQHWHSANRESSWPREDKTCHFANHHDNSGSQEAPVSGSSYK